MIIKEIIKNYISSNKTNRIKKVLEIATFNSVNNVKPIKIRTIAIVVPELHKFTGGHTSIIRLGSLLARKGFDVSYVSYVNQSINEMQEVLKANYSSAQGNCISYHDAMERSYDLIVATNWVSVYWSKLLSGYKAYFVQDYEPYFYMVDEEYELAKETYELGFHIISLGKWNIDQINKNCVNKGLQSYISFPYEPSEYRLSDRDFYRIQKTKRIKLAVYTKENGKRMANLMQCILLKAKEEFEHRGFEFLVQFFGLKKEYRVDVGVNLGKLNKEEMNQLYVDSDFGFVASMTNISLVPYEMMGTGLPIIEFKNGSYSSFLPKEAAILIDFDYRTLVNEIEDCINNPERLMKMRQVGLSATENLSWNNTVNEFVSILNSEVIRNE